MSIKITTKCYQYAPQLIEKYTHLYGHYFVLNLKKITKCHAQVNKRFAIHWILFHNVLNRSQGYSGKSYDRFVEQRETSTLHKFKETFWTTKQAVMQKLGKKEDEHVVASDSQLDSKLEVCFIRKTCTAKCYLFTALWQKNR